MNFPDYWHTLILAVAVTFLFPRLAAGQQANADDYKFSVRSNLVLLPTRVQSKTGETIYGLRPNNSSLKTMASANPSKSTKNPILRVCRWS